jgi:hypothetical protein
MTRFLIAFVLVFAAALPGRAHEPMSLDRLVEIVVTVDPDAQVAGTSMTMTVSEVPVIIVTDPGADRMRAMVPIRSADGISDAEMRRMMQANFDTALDARYAVAKGRLWAAFIHPLSRLDKDEFLQGVGQAVNLATTYGSTYNSGLLSFGGGDSNALNRALIDDLLKKGEKI